MSGGPVTLRVQWRAMVKVRRQLVDRVQQLDKQRERLEAKAHAIEREIEAMERTERETRRRVPYADYE